MCPRARTLPAAEIAVGGIRAAFSRSDQITVDADAHRAAGFAPFEPGVEEDAIEPLLFRLTLDQRRAGGNKARHLAGPTSEDDGRSTQILDAGVGAGADEHTIDRDVGQ